MSSAPTHIMLDLETLGTRPGSVVTTIGAVQFDPFTGEIGEQFLARVDIESAVAAGLTIDPKTVKWWLQQSDAARLANFAAAALQLPEALFDFKRWLTSWRTLRIWGHGATFDPVLLSEAYRACSIPLPWGHRDPRDTRTVFELAGIDDPYVFREADDVAHDALSDARVQVRALTAAYRKLGLSNGGAA